LRLAPARETFYELTPPELSELTPLESVVVRFRGLQGSAVARNSRVAPTRPHRAHDARDDWLPSCHATFTRQQLLSLVTDPFR